MKARQLIEVSHRRYRANAVALANAARDAHGVLMAPDLPSPAAWQSELDRYAPGCGSPIRVPGTSGGRMRCGATLDGQPEYCEHCHKALAV